MRANCCLLYQIAALLAILGASGFARADIIVDNFGQTTSDSQSTSAYFTYTNPPNTSTVFGGVRGV